MFCSLGEDVRRKKALNFLQDLNHLSPVGSWASVTVYSLTEKLKDRGRKERMHGEEVKGRRGKSLGGKFQPVGEACTKTGGEKLPLLRN